MTTTYTKSLSGDFGGSLNKGQFHKEIDEDGGITPTLIQIKENGDVIDIIFDSALSGGEQSTLDTLISNHIPDTGQETLVVKCVAGQEANLVEVKTDAGDNRFVIDKDGELTQIGAATATNGNVLEFDGNKWVPGVGGGGGSGDVVGPSSSGDNYIPRFDGTTGKLIQGPTSGQISYDDDAQLTITGSKNDFLFKIHNTINSNGKGLSLRAGENSDDIVLHIIDQDETFPLLDLTAGGNMSLGKTFSQTNTDNGVVYGVDNQHGGNEADFNTQNGVYRIGGTDVVNVSQTLTNKTITSTNNNVAAKSLHSSSTLVDVSSASAPTSGQVLTATSGTTATWQNPSGGSVFGSEYQYASSEVESSTTSTILITKTILTTSSLPSGTYRLGYSFELSNANNGVLTEINVELDGSTVCVSTFESDNDYHAHSGFYVTTLSGIINAYIKYKVVGGTALIRRARLELYRVA